MAILRESQASNPVSRAAAPDITQSSGGAVKQPNVRKFAKDPSTTDMLLDSVVKVGGALASQAWEVQKEEAYLSGVRQSAEQESEQELQSSAFTRDWTKAGFRDTKGKLAQAGFMASLPSLIQESLTQPDPQKSFSDAMAQAQRGLVTSYEGMSRQSRAALFAQNATDIHTAQSSFTKEYAKHIITTEEKALQSSFTAMRQQLDTNKDDPKAYAAASQSFTAGVYTNVWLNPKLPHANKVELTKQALQYAASTDNVQVYSMLKEQQFEFPGGAKGTIMQQLSFEDQIALDTAQRKAMERTKVIRASDFEDTMARQRAEWSDKDGPGPTISYEELSGQLDLALDNGLLSAGKRETVLKEFFTAKARNNPNDLMAQRYAAGDFPAIVAAGGSEEDGLRAYLKSMEGQPYQETVQGLLSIGNNSGMASALKKAGELMSPTIGQLGLAEDIDPESAAMAHSFIQALDQSEVNNPGAYSKMLSGLTEDNQNMLLLMREAQRTGGIADPATAVQWARTKLKEGKGAAAKAARTSNAKADSKVVQELDTTAWYELIDRNFGDASAIRPERGFWFEDEDRTAAITGTSKVVLSEEFDRINLTSPFLSDSSRSAKAFAAAAARAVPTPSGPVFLPPGQSVHQYFKAPQIADKAYIGKAIEDLVPLESGQRVEWSMSQIQGAPMLFRITNEDGATISSGSLDPKNVGVRVQENLDVDAATAAQHVGPGKVIYSKAQGAFVQANGQNTAGFQPGAMLALREDIVASEGIVTTAYADDSVVAGNKAFGVGISQTGKRFEEPRGTGGVYTQDQINDSFMQASNDAAETASRAMRGIGVGGTDWLRFFGELAYQSPGSARDATMLTHIQLGNTEGAIEALKATNAYKNSQPARQEKYLNKLKKAMQ